MFSLIFLVSLLVLVRSQSIQPPAIPLAVRSPYLQSFLSHTSTTAGSNQWPSFWTTNHTLGWSGLLRVDDVPYEWLGAAVEGGGLTLSANATAATLKSYQVTPTRTILTLTAGAMDINVTFLNPIERSNLVLQSLSFTYIYFEASSTDGNSHSLQVYQDISGEWTSSNTSNILNWNTTVDGSIIYHEEQRASYQSMVEENNMAEDATVYHVTTAGSGVTYQTGRDVSLRSLFLNNGTLNNTQDNTDRAISNDWPVLAFCTDLGNISSTSSPVVWAIGLVRKQDIVFTTTSGNQTRQPYFFTQYQDVPSAMSDLMSDASSALQRAITLDNTIVSAASNISSNYADLVSLATRQVMAGMEITAGTGSDGQLNASDIFIFMKDLGNSQRVNPVEVLYASFPAILYLNATWAGYLLRPLMEFEASALYSQTFAAPDLGNSYPSAVGNTDPAVSSAIESTSDMLIMAWAHATFTGDGSLISQYYTTLTKWANTLISESPLTPAGYTTADGLGSANMTNLAIKGILAIRTMAEISRTLGASSDYNAYSANASSLVSQWQTLAGQSGHLTSTYSSTSSWGMMYNLYPDKLFGFDFVNESIYTEQTEWYTSETSNAASYGLPFDSNEPTTAKSQWTLFTAATVTDLSTRDSFVSMVHASAANLANFAVFPTTYGISDGSIDGGQASPAQGAMFALLALNMTKHTITGFTPISESSPSSSSSKSHAGAIAGGVVGGVAFVALAAIALFFFRRRSNRIQASNEGTDPKSLAKNNSVVSPSQDPLNKYYIEPIVMAHKPSQQYVNTPTTTSHPTLSSFGEMNPPMMPYPAPLSFGRTPLRLRNGEENSPAPLPQKTQSETGSSDAAALRSEVEILRREMEEMRRTAAFQPPPEYE